MTTVPDTHTIVAKLEEIAVLLRTLVAHERAKSEAAARARVKVHPEDRPRVTTRPE